MMKGNDLTYLECLNHCTTKKIIKPNPDIPVNSNIPALPAGR